MDPETFDAFYTTSFGRLVGQVYAMCGNFAEAQDCVQEAFVRAWDKRLSLDPDLAPEAWVRTVAYRLAVSRWRRAKRALQPPDRAKQPDRTPAEPDVNGIALARALAGLPAEQRRAIVLHHLCDLSVAEVAREVGAPEGTIKARLSRGRATLAAQLRSEPVPSPRAA
ncbi:RNA polymerase sigma factor [Microlunatus sp. GCM10028923]|uniref:RNA polymerase sigma factor n=1 Tax=Microlunatus sp. GCM10028923 TaxID=3273400 RepID=UPI00360E7859